MRKTIEELQEEIVSHLNLLIQTAERENSAARLGNLCNELSRHYRAFGICCLLADADVDAFFHWLLQSAIVRRFYLRAAARQHLSGERHLRASFVDPFVDAIVANQWPLALRIAALSPSDWMEGSEYEDDFAWAHCLHLLAQTTPPEPALVAVLARWESALEGGDDVRLEVARALVARDQKAFDDAFEALLRERSAKMDAIADPKLDSILAQDYAFEPNRHVFVEGLAVLRIATARGLLTATEYPTCPAAARRTKYAPFKPLAFPSEPVEENAP